MNEYLLVIVEAPWNPGTISEEQWAQEWKRHNAFADAVRDAGGTITASNALKPVSEATRVDPARDGAAAVFTDAPFAGLEEVPSGFYQITAVDDAAAKRLAALCPTNGHVDVFPVLDISGTK